VPHRDGWRCQFCGSRINLELDHQRFRSHSGEDRGEISSHDAQTAIWFYTMLTSSALAGYFAFVATPAWIASTHRLRCSVTRKSCFQARCAFCASIQSAGRPRHGFRDWGSVQKLSPFLLESRCGRVLRYRTNRTRGSGYGLKLLKRDMLAKQPGTADLTSLARAFLPT
jgi:hypothetical protein